MECTYQTDESGSVQTIKVQTDESLKSVISEINEIEEKTDADDSQEKLKQQVISDYVELRSIRRRIQIILVLQFRILQIKIRKRLHWGQS